MKIGVLVIATGKYTQFIPPLYTSIKKHFMKNEDVKILITELWKAAKGATQIAQTVDLQNSTFKFGQASFDSASNYPYIKLRLTSKKTNRKIDINLNYTFLQTIKVINEQELKSKNTIKINEQ